MSIVLEVQPYCANCLDFEADVTKPGKVYTNYDEIVLGDTIIRCEYARRCENIRKYFIRQEKNNTTSMMKE